MKILCMGETLLRYSTKKGCRMSDLAFDVHVGGSETNIAISLANFGFESLLFSKISNSFLGDGIIKFLRGYNVDIDRVIRSDQRVGCYYLENGSGNRASQVLYDRANSAMTSLTKEEIDIVALCKDIDVFVVSGITVALSKEIEEIVLLVMKYCNKHNIKVVYDSNYRSKLWTTKEAGEAMHTVLPYVNILSAGTLDAINILGMKSDKEGYENRLLDFYQQMTTIYPAIEYIVATKRDIISTSVNTLQGYLYDGKTLHQSSTYHIDDIVDRVGGGDAFMAGILYGLLTNQSACKTLEFASAASVLKHTIHGDANQFSVQEVNDFIENGISRIVR